MAVAAILAALEGPTLARKDGNDFAHLPADHRTASEAWLGAPTGLGAGSGDGGASDLDEGVGVGGSARAALVLAYDNIKAALNRRLCRGGRRVDGNCEVGSGGGGDEEGVIGASAVCLLQANARAVHRPLVARVAPPSPLRMSSILGGSEARSSRSGGGDNADSSTDHGVDYGVENGAGLRWARSLDGDEFVAGRFMGAVPTGCSAAARINASAARGAATSLEQHPSQRPPPASALCCSAGLAFTPAAPGSSGGGQDPCYVFPWHADSARSPRWRYTAILYLSTNQGTSHEISQELRPFPSERLPSELNLSEPSSPSERVVGGGTAFAWHADEKGVVKNGTLVLQNLNHGCVRLLVIAATPPRVPAPGSLLLPLLPFSCNTSIRPMGEPPHECKGAPPQGPGRDIHHGVRERAPGAARRRRLSRHRTGRQVVRSEVRYRLVRVCTLLLRDYRICALTSTPVMHVLRSELA